MTVFTRTAGAIALALTAAMPIAAQADGPRNLVTVVTAPEPQTQMMSMVLSMQALKSGARTHILLCGPAGDLALREPPETATAPQGRQGMSPQGLMQAIMAGGGTVEVCALYLPGKGIGPEALLEGIAPARPPEMAARLMADDTRVLSF